jgi:uncharacterized protein (DUF1501 family)
MSPVTRRRFIQGLLASGAIGYAAFGRANPLGRSDSSVAGLAATSDGQPVLVVDADSVAALGSEAEPLPEDRPLLTPAPLDQRVLVLIELDGGNDGPSTVVPYASGTYYDLRPNLAVPAEEVHQIDDQVGLAPGLSRIARRQFMTVEGVGPVEGTLSHFEMTRRWNEGDMLGQGGQRSGFLARLVDAVDTGATVTGLSVGGHSPRLDSVVASTLTFDDVNQLRVLTNPDWMFPLYRSAMSSFSGGPVAQTVAASWQTLGQVGGSIRGSIDYDKDKLKIEDGGDLGRQLALAAEMIKADIGIRVIHAKLGGFDTHDGHNWRHSDLMQKLDVAVDGFLRLLDDAGLEDRVLVATSSEFGRRGKENGNGLDHGAASSMLLIGPVTPGRAGDPSPLNDLDSRGNLRTTIPFDRYLASLAQDWLGVDPAAILPGSPQALNLI